MKLKKGDIVIGLYDEELFLEEVISIGGGEIKTQSLLFEEDPYLFEDMDKFLNGTSNLKIINNPQIYIDLFT